MKSLRHFTQLRTMVIDNIFSPKKDCNMSRLILSESLRSVGFSLPTILCNHHSYTTSDHKDTNREEEPEEPLGIVTEVATIIFLVSFTNFLPFISKHGIDLTNMRLHLCGHPLAFFGKQFLDFLPVSIIDIYRHL